MQNLQEKCDAEAVEARRRREETEDEVAGVRRDWEETKRQMEEDVDTEVEKLKRSYVRRRTGRLNPVHQARLPHPTPAVWILLAV